jgi:hypothetical protein
MYNLKIEDSLFTIKFHHLRILPLDKRISGGYENYPFKDKLSKDEYIKNFYEFQFEYKDRLTSIKNKLIEISKVSYGQGKPPKHSKPIATICVVEVKGRTYYDFSILGEKDNFSYKLGRSISLGRLVDKNNLPKELLSVI